MRELLLYPDFGVLFSPSITRELRRTERRVAASARRAVRNSPFRSWSCIPELELLPSRPTVLSRSARFLAALGDPAKPKISAHNVTVVALRPGDEILACGATLARLKGVRVIVAGTGVPTARNFPSRAGSRWRELLDALALAGLKSSAAIGLGLNEGESGQDEPALPGRLARQFFRDGTALVLTPMGERSDPGMLRAVEAAILKCRLRGQEIGLIGMPSAEAADNADLVLALDAREQALKRRMLASFAAARLRRQFYDASECFRFVPATEVVTEFRVASRHPARALPEVELQATA
ncbi:MAG TPA: hypothetical protein VEU06_12155 [Micropepsaceae bacterium]|nr:hypothetical protein [Micropepsaceae bacterium]